MSDTIDRANELAELHLMVALQNRPVAAVLPISLECEDCGEPIPEARRLAVPGCSRCTSCQQDADRRARNG